MSTLKQVADQALELAQSKGAEADCIIDKVDRLSFKAEDGVLSEYKVSGSQVLGIRVVKDDHVGTSYSEALDIESIRFMVDQALENARLSKNDPNQRIQVQRSEIIDGSHDRILQADHTPLEEKVQFALDLEAQVKAKHPAVKAAPYNNLSEIQHERLYVNSLGTFCTQKERSFSCYTSALIEQDQQQGMHYHSSIARSFAQLNLDEVVEESYKHAHGLLHATPLSTGHYTIRFEINVLHSLMSAFGSLFSAKGAMNGVNPWKEKLHTSVANSMLTIVDHPTHTDAFSYHPFDDEGNLTQSTTLISDGVLQNFYHNTATADYFQVENTYHASRSPKGTLGVSGSTVFIQPGSSSEEDLLQDEYFEVIALQGLHSGCNAVSGDFSLGASGYLKKGQEIVQAVKEVTISGNYFTLLNSIAAMGNQVHVDSGASFFAPCIMFEGITVAGT